ncbi:hypothetical protein F4560_000793 [Saccharothrix ecbatanensis]|uniref:Ricin B lectin domain-containing protein n=1 Tax=Saccharothrix ecbatanensis TaxID=1105145 RepID=A0A7W9LYM2_9PSEU|nr:RICIN domain-containing protein [Saccharothrix ecbatanensis]MBB5801025.1 hypothetical protein [Saccharothrix ecbatanensis]
MASSTCVCRTGSSLCGTSSAVRDGTWNGTTSSGWSAPVLDVAGYTHSVGGVNQIGGGRPGMPNVVPTPDGRLIYNAHGSGDVWVNPSGSSTGAWTRQFTTIEAGYSRNLTYVPRTGRVLIVTGFGTIRHADIDFGRSAGPYYKLVNRRSGKLLDAYGADLADSANIVQWADNGGFNQHWHVTDIGGGYRALLNRNSGRAVSIYGASTADAAGAVQWVQNLAPDQAFTLEPVGDYYEIRARHSGKLLTVATGSTANGAQVIQWPDQNLTEQQWSLVQVSS